MIHWYRFEVEEYLIKILSEEIAVEMEKEIRERLIND